MTARPASAVLDASVCVASALPDEEASALAGRLMRELQALDVRLFAPPVWRYEVAHAFRGAVLRRRIEAGDAWYALSRLLQLPLEVVELAPDDWEIAWHLALSRHIGAYDASYLALAYRLECQCITTDHHLVNAASSTGLVRWIGDFS